MVFYLVLSGNRGLWNLYQLDQEHRRLESEILRLKVEINRFQEDYGSFGKSDSALEKVAREELNLIKPGELVFRFPKSQGR
jgi:cell division protein FtsB